MGHRFIELLQTKSNGSSYDVVLSDLARCRLMDVKQLLRRTREYPQMLSLRCYKPAMTAPLEINKTAAAKENEMALLFCPMRIPKKKTKKMSVLLKARNMGILMTASAFIPQKTPLMQAREQGSVLQVWESLSSMIPLAFQRRGCEGVGYFLGENSLIRVQITILMDTSQNNNQAQVMH